MGSSNSRRSRTMSTSSETETEVLGAQGGSDYPSARAAEYPSPRGIDCPPPRGAGGSDCPAPSRGANSSTRTGVEEDQHDLQAILAYLIRSGQVRIVTQHEEGDDEGEYSDDYEFCSSASKPPRPDDDPDTSRIDVNDIKNQILGDSGRLQKNGIMKKKPTTLVGLLQNREIGRRGNQQFTCSDRRAISCQYLPNSRTVIDNYYHKAFCGTYSKEGNIFLTAAQDPNLRIYNTENGKFDKFKTIRARDVGWSVLDTAFSPDGLYMAYSSWSDCIHLCNIYGEEDTHKSLHLFPGDHSFSIFSLAFSSDNREILGGANDGCLYIYDRHEDKRTLKIDAHEDDVNAVTFADDSSHILFSGGDDGLCKVWDRRTLRDDNPLPVGVLAGHCDGITYIDPKGDARYLLSNSKDQTMKLWDIRMFSSQCAISNTKKAVSKQRWDYRWQQVPRKVQAKKTLEGDTSVMTYRGHSILHTLIRCHFSPQYTTGQRYAYTGCATGAVVIYDLLTGEIVTKLTGHKQCVRDVSWHPYENTLVSTSWDGMVGKWEYMPEEDSEDEYSDTSDSDESPSEDNDLPPRRSRRLADTDRRQVEHFQRQALFD